jgi:hypothetical protein
VGFFLPLLWAFLCPAWVILLPFVGCFRDFHGWLAFYWDRVDFHQIYVDLFLNAARLAAAADALPLAFWDRSIKSSVW